MIAEAPDRRFAWPWWLLGSVLALAWLIAQPTRSNLRQAAVWPVQAELTVPAALAAAALAGPHADDLHLHLRADAVPLTGVLGARGQSWRAGLPFSWHSVAVRVLSPLVAQRPALLELALPQLPQWQATVSLRHGQSADAVLEAEPWPTDGVAHELRFLPPQAGSYQLAIELRGEVTVRLRGELVVQAKAPVLVMEPTGLCSAILQAQGAAVEPARALPLDLAAYDALLLGHELDAAAQQQVLAAVADGLGLFVLEPAFGQGEAPLRALLPLLPAALSPRATAADTGNAPGLAQPAVPPTVPPAPPPVAANPPTPNLPPKEAEVDRRLVALGLVIDRSGSMAEQVGDRTKMDYAKASALATATALGEGDEVTVVTFGNRDRGRVELPLTQAQASEQVALGVRKLAAASEHTYLLSGLRVAAEQLRGSKAVVRHLVVITDGEFQLSEDVALRALARQLAETERMTLSVIAITSPSTQSEFAQFAEELTRAAGGRYLPLHDSQHVPQFVAAEVARSLASAGRAPTATGTGEAVADAPSNAPPEPPAQPSTAPAPNQSTPRPAERELPVVAVVPSPLLGTRAGDWPYLTQARAGTAKPSAEVLLACGAAGWPLLAFGNHGLGRVGAFAADLCGEPARAFRADAQLPALLGQWLAHVQRPRSQPVAALDLTLVAVDPAAPSAETMAAFAALCPMATDAATAVPPAPRLVTVADQVPALPGWLPLPFLLLLALAERRKGILAGHAG